MTFLSQSERKKRLEKIRSILKTNTLDGFIIPRGDEHQGEYVAAKSERLAWATGFTGSAGFGLISTQGAAVFSDSRYTLQLKQQCPAEFFDHRSSQQDTAAEWFAETTPKGGVIGADPWLHSVAEWQRLETELSAQGLRLVPCDNMIDLAWDDQPEAPKKPIHGHDLSYSGKDHLMKCAEIGATLKQQGQDCAILTLPDSIAWLLNIRGNDLPCTPTALAFACLHQDGSVDLFIDPEQMTDDLRKHLGPLVTCHPIQRFTKEIQNLSGTIRLDPHSIPAHIAHLLEDQKACQISYAQDPCILPKAEKNKTEIEGARKAHLKDGIAVTKFLYWLDQQAAQDVPVTELQAVKRLRLFREADPDFKDDSFETISGAGENGAIVHYRATEESNRPLHKGELYLCDSGGQYPYGTTDITRTIIFGETPSQEMKEDFTRVLKGHIQLARVQFPKGTDGKTLDVLARAPLWDVGKDYGHGTGHGVGSYLSVHEGPQGIHKRSTQPLTEGMIVSNEPGYYLEGQYGIRLENLICVSAENATGFQQFETLTLAPFDQRLIEPNLLADEDLKWLNEYHQRVYQALSPALDPAEKRWLAQATAPLAKKPQAPAASSAPKAGKKRRLTPQ